MNYYLVVALADTVAWPIVAIVAIWAVRSLWLRTVKRMGEDFK